MKKSKRIAKQARVLRKIVGADLHAAFKLCTVLAHGNYPPKSSVDVLRAVAAANSSTDGMIPPRPTKFWGRVYHRYASRAGADQPRTRLTLPNGTKVELGDWVDVGAYDTVQLKGR